MSKKPLDPNLAAILDSIRATVGGEAPPPAAEPEAPAAVAAPPAPPVPRAPQRTVEDFLADLIRPQVDAWLKANLPEIVQKLTAEEIARMLNRD